MSVRFTRVLIATAALAAVLVSVASTSHARSGCYYCGGATSGGGTNSGGVNSGGSGGGGGGGGGNSSTDSTTP